MTNIEITQADREAAAREFARRFNSPFEEHLAVIRDENSLVQAFARHRIEARAAALEEAAKVADERAEAYRTLSSAVLFNRARLCEADRIAKAIRALKGEQA